MWKKEVYLAILCLFFTLRFIFRKKCFSKNNNNVGRFKKYKKWPNFGKWQKEEEVDLKLELRELKTVAYKSYLLGNIQQLLKTQFYLILTPELRVDNCGHFT